MRAERAAELQPELLPLLLKVERWGVSWRLKLYRDYESDDDDGEVVTSAVDLHGIREALRRAGHELPAVLHDHSIETFDFLAEMGLRFYWSGIRLRRLEKGAFEVVSITSRPPATTAREKRARQRECIGAGCSARIELMCAVHAGAWPCCRDPGCRPFHEAGKRCRYHAGQVLNDVPRKGHCGRCRIAIGKDRKNHHCAKCSSCLGCAAFPGCGKPLAQPTGEPPRCDDCSRAAAKGAVNAA